MHPLVNIALRAARDAAEAVAHSSDRLDRVKILDTPPGEFMTSMDKDSNRTVLYHLQQTYPDHSFMSRVSGFEEGEDKSVTWFIDPLVGNYNFANGYTQFGVSVACQVNGKLAHAVLINPMQNEEYTASRGAGAQLNARRIRVAGATTLSAGMFSLNIDNANQEIGLELQKQLLSQPSVIRNSGCTALDMLAVASGRLTGGWSIPQQSMSVAAAKMILSEAGGLLGDHQGNPAPDENAELLFANPRCFKELLKLRSNIC